MSKGPQDILNRLIVDRETFDENGTRRQVTGTISLPEATFIRQLIIDNEFRTCLETGVAYGASTVAICSALLVLKQTSDPVRHYGVDPWQRDAFGGAAIAALRECGLEDVFELCGAPSHLALPRLIDRGITVDFAFVDGMHTFDYTLIDLFFCDKLLRPGGIICIHDLTLPSKKSAIRYLTRYRRYVRLRAIRKPLSKRAGAALKEAFKFAPRSSWNYLTTAEPMLVLKKVAHFEPAWDFYAPI